MCETTRGPRRPTACGRRWRAIALAVALLPGAGCGREFYRNWADQDVSEAVFEKSRDPRWRLDLFSIEPPALSRFADPYDPDRPPAPPDDRAAEALSPVPQWPHHRLLVPVEGTGYADMLEAWQRQRPVPAPSPAPAATNGGPGAAYPSPTPPPPPAETPSPFEPGMAPPEEPVPPEPVPPEPVLPESALPELNSGPNLPGLSPIVPGEREQTPLPPLDRDAGPGTGPPQARSTTTNPQDPGVHLAALQLPPPPAPGAAESPGPAGAPGPVPPEDLIPEPVDPGRQVPADPRLNSLPELEQPALEATTDLASFLPPRVEVPDAEAAGLPRDSRAYVITPEQALTLALTNSRAYQFRLENIYLAGLGVALQRFQFAPQFSAEVSPLSYTYRTRETGSQSSELRINTLAGFSKLLSFGTRVAGSFANETVINFTGGNIRRPRVQSFLPLTIVQPFLRGGGRALTLEPLTQTERNLLYEVRDFARFRQQFVTSILTVREGVSGAGIGDPAVGYLQILQQLLVVENSFNNLRYYQVLLGNLQEAMGGEGSNIAPLDVIQIESQLQQSRQQYLGQVNDYRDQVDQYRIQLGLPPDVPLILDRALIRRFSDVFTEIDQVLRDQLSRVIQRRPSPDVVDRADLEAIVQRLPELEEVLIDGRPVLGWATQPDRLEDLLLAGERVALENRVDLMTARAQLYDAWRQLAVAANQLKGVFNVMVTNEFQTPPTTTNPFGFNDQTKQFALVLNAELPLVRLAERNAYMGAHIDYNRQRRVLMATEDALKFQVRQEIRSLQTLAQQYEVLKVNLVAAQLQADSSSQSLFAPAAGGAGGAGGGQGSQSTTQILIQGQQRVTQVQSQLIQTWVNFQAQRLALYRDLGIMPYDEWEAFHELFPAANSRPDVPGTDARPAAPASTRAPQGVAAR